MASSVLKSEQLLQLLWRHRACIHECAGMLQRVDRVSVAIHLGHPSLCDHRGGERTQTVRLRAHTQTRHTASHHTHTQCIQGWHASLCAMRRQMPCACRLATPLCPPTDCVHSGVGAWNKHVPPSSGINVPAWCTYVPASCTDVLATEPMYYSNINA